MSSEQPFLPPAAEPHDEDLEASLHQLASKLFPQDEVQKNMRFMEEMEAKVTELETRLSMAEETKALALKERDAADEARKKLEKTLAELLSKFASARENHSVVLREMEEIRAANAARRDSVEAEHREVGHLRETNAKLVAENEELKEKVESQFLNLEVLQTQLRSEHQTLDTVRHEMVELRKREVANLKPALAEHEMSSSEMVANVDDLVDQLNVLRDEIARRCTLAQSLATNLGDRLRTTHTQLVVQLQPAEAKEFKPPVEELEDMEELPPARATDSGLRAMASGVRAV